MKYYQRTVDVVIKRKLRSSGSLLIVGPMWCGKTKSAENACKSTFYLDPEDDNALPNVLARSNPDLVLEGTKPRLIDEWQVAPTLWGKVKKYIDNSETLGNFILTGSSTPIEPQSTNHHPGTGRINPIRMRPMSLFESKDSSGEISLTDLFEQRPIKPCVSPIKSNEYPFYICRGGWPGILHIKNKEDQLEVARDYLNTYVGPNANNAYIKRMKVNKTRLMLIIRSLSRNIASYASIDTIVSDIKANESNTISEKTVSKYIDILNELFLIEDLTGWNPRLRSKAAFRKGSTRLFTDPSIATSALQICPKDLLSDYNTLGLLFESLVIRDLRCYADALDGNVYKYHDNNDLECDAVVHLNDGRYGLIEVKYLDPLRIEEGVKNLNRLSEKLDYTKMKKPSFMAIVYAGEYAYKRDDGIYMIPLGCLGV